MRTIHGWKDLELWHSATDGEACGLTYRILLCDVTERRMRRVEVLAMIKRRAKRVGLSPTICCHTSRATGITTCLENGGTIENDQPYYLLCRNLFSLLAA